jgi:hypothetical protein
MSATSMSRMVLLAFVAACGIPLVFAIQHFRREPPVETIHVRGDGPKVRAVDVQKVRGEFERLYATGEADPKKRADASRKAFKRTLAELPPQFATESQEGRELIWKVD